MKRWFLCLALLPTLALAQSDWPARPVKILVGFPAGGANDLVARSVAARLSDSLKQPFLVENRSGAAGTIAADAGAKAAPDGYTLFSLTSSQVLAPSVRKSVPFDPVKDYKAIALLENSSYFLAVHPSVAAKSVAEFVALARAKKGAMDFASSGSGAGPHMTMALFMAVAGLEINHVPYRGDADALVDLVAGRVQSGFMSIAPTYPHIAAGALRALAVSGAERSPLLPNLPTVAESGYPGFEYGVWWGLVGPAALPDAIARKLGAAIRPILESKEYREQFASQGIVPGRELNEAFQRRIADDFVKFADVARKAGVVPQ